MFYGFVITEGGNHMLAKMVAGEQLKISRVVAGKGTAESKETARKMTALIEPVANGTSTTPITNGSTTSMIVEFRSDLDDGLTEGFWIGEFGVFAKDPDTKEDVLIYYGSLGEQKQYISAYTPGTAPDSRKYPVSITVTAGVEVTLEYPAEVWMTADEVDAMLKAHNDDPAAHKALLDRFGAELDAKQFRPQVLAYAAAGTAVTCTDGVTTLEENADTSGKALFKIPNYGRWTVGSETETADTDENDQPITEKIVAVVDVVEVKRYAVKLSGASVFGVEWDYGNPSTALTRLTPANDPSEYVTEAVTEEPVPAIGNGIGTSPFDMFMPWSGMEEFNINNGVISYGRGGEAADTMVYIPEFYYAVQDDAVGKKRRYYISDTPQTGFAKHPGSGRYVSRYVAGGIGDPPEDGNIDFETAVSRSGLAPFVNISRGDARSVARAKGDKWCQYDFATYSAIIMLYIVEFADWDSQAMIGSGICGNHGFSEGQPAGLTDDMNYHTGRALRIVDGEEDIEENCQIQYRHIEGLWGNVFQWVDGINFIDRGAWICKNPANYADDTEQNYIDTGMTLAVSGYITELGFDPADSWAIIPNANGGSETSFIPDRVSSNASGWRVLRVGGSWATTAGSVGLLYFVGLSAASYVSGNGGFRLLYIP